MRILFFISKALEETQLIFLIEVRFIKSETLKGAQPIFLTGITFIKLEALKEARLIFLMGVTLIKGALSLFALEIGAITFLLDFFARFSDGLEASEDSESDVSTCFFLKELWNLV